MNFIDSEYLVPVLIGERAERLRVARRLCRVRGIRAHFFAQDFSLFQRLFFRCHKVSPFRDVFLAESLIGFADALEEFYCPVLVLCDEKAQAFYKRRAEDLGAYYVALTPCELFEGTIES